MKYQLKLISVLLFGLIQMQAIAQTSNLSIQGIVKTIEGNAVENGEYDLTFKLYDVEVAGTVLWQETITDVRINGGIYSVILGAGDTPLDVPFNVPYYLGVSVDGDVDLYPRARLTSSPYALSLIGDDNIFPNSGNVGVGSDNPQSKLTVARENAVLGLDAEEGATNNATITSKADGLEFSTDGANNAYYFLGEISEVMRIKKDGKIGIGTSDPQNILHIVGDDAQLKVEGTDNANIIFTKTSGSATLGFDATNGDDLQLTNPLGTTKIEGNNITLNPSSGTATIQGNTNIDGTVEINKNGEALKLIGVDSSYIAFYPNGVSNGQKSFIGYSQSSPYGANDLTFYNSQEGDMIFGIEGGAYNHEYIFKDGRVYIQGQKTHYFGEAPDRATRGQGRYWGGVGNYAMGLMVSYDIGTRAVNLWSDKRIKKDLKLSNNQADLKLLQQVEVTDYRHIDEKANGTGITKGFIAQQIAAIYPEAVNKSTNAIPSILALPSEIKEENGAQIIRLERKHELEVNNIVKILSDSKEESVAVTRVIDPYTFVVQLSELKADENIFVYGKEVNDFHAVDYNKVFTLNVSATQELARQVEALQKENAQLKAANAQTSKYNNDLKAALNTLTDRINNIEALLDSSAGK